MHHIAWNPDDPPGRIFSGFSSHLESDVTSMIWPDELADLRFSTLPARKCGLILENLWSLKLCSPFAQGLVLPGGIPERWPLRVTSRLECVVLNLQPDFGHNFQAAGLFIGGLGEGLGDLGLPIRFLSV